MLRFRLRADHPMDIYRPAGQGGSLRVEAGAEIEVAGALVTARPKPKDDEPEPTPLPEDAYIVSLDGEEKAWPHALWELVEDKPAAKAAAVKEN